MIKIHSKLILLFYWLSDYYNQFVFSSKILYMHFCFTCQIFQKIYFNVFLNYKNVFSFWQHHSRVHVLPYIVKMPCPTIRNHIISYFYVTFEWGVKDKHTHSLFTPSKSLHLHVPDKKEGDCWCLHKTFPKQLCQRFPRLSPDSVIFWKTHRAQKSLYT